MDKLFALSLGFAGLILATHAGHGQPRPDCGPRAQVLEVLAGTYRETRRGIGLAGPQQMVEVFASGTTGSWTNTVTLPDGRMCLIGAGQSWEDRAEPLPGTGAPA